MSADPTLDFLSSGGGTVPAASGDPTHDFLASGGEMPDNSPQAPVDINKEDLPKILYEGGKQLIGMGAHGLGTLVDVATGTSPGEGSHAERFAKPFEVPSSIQDIEQAKDNAAIAAPVTKTISKGYDATFGTGPRAQAAKDTLAERIPQAAEAIQTAVPLIKMGAAPFTARPSWNRPIQGGSEMTAADIPRTASPEMLEQFQDETPAAPKPEGSPDKGPAPDSVLARARVLHDVGLTDARNSALANDGPAAMSEFQTSKDPTSQQGLEARAIFDRERQALTNFGQNIVQKTGGTLGTDGATLEARGNTILKPFDDLQDWYDKQRQAMYAAADAKAQGVPTDLKGFQDVLKDDSLMTNQDRVGLRSGLNAYLKKLGVVDDNGNVTASVQQAETVRKYLNDEWSPQNSKLVGKLKDALDDDVTQAAGADVYKGARALVAQQKNTLENPNGLGNLLDASGPGGINRKVPVEKVPDKILSMPQAQLEHVVTTLREMPQELQPQAQTALQELQAQYANRLSDVGNKFEGPWNHRGVNQFLDNNSGKAPLIFGEDNPLLLDMDTLRAAGNILRVDRGYPGAAIQGKILRSKLLPAAITGLGGLAGEVGGSMMGMPGIGTAVGSSVAGTAARKLGENAGVKALRQRVTRLSDLGFSDSSRGGPSP